MAKNYYDTLGIDKSASKDDVKKAFRKLAHQYHPDKKGGDEVKFKEASEAYDVLSDDSKRSQYDTYGTSGAGGGQGAGGFNPNDFSGFDFSGFNRGNGGVEFDLGDIFGDFFGGGRGGSGGQKKGRDISVDIEISFEESIFGADKEIRLSKTTTCQTCGGNGAKKGTQLDTCGICNGKGKVAEMRRSIIGSFQTVRTCENCHGSGKVPKEKCETCKGHGVTKQEQTLKISIPSGLENGEMLRMNGQGEAMQGGVSGDLYIKVHIKQHQLFKKAGNDLVMDLKVKLSDALLGGSYAIKTLDGDIDLKIPEGLSIGQILRVKGKGVPYANGKRGDILVRSHIDIPNKLSKDVQKLVEELRSKGV